MPITTPVWSTEQTAISTASIAAGASADGDVNLASSGWDMLKGAISVALGTSTGVRVHVYRSTDGGVTFAEAESLAGGFIINADGKYPMPDIFREAHVRIRAAEISGTDATGSVTVTYQGLKWNTT